MPGLNINGWALGREVTFKISFDGKIETFISTLDDLIQCIEAAEGTLNSVYEEHRR